MRIQFMAMTMVGGMILGACTVKNGANSGDSVVKASDQDIKTQFIELRPEDVGPVQCPDGAQGAAFYTKAPATYPENLDSGFKCSGMGCWNVVPQEREGLTLRFDICLGSDAMVRFEQLLIRRANVGTLAYTKVIPGADAIVKGVERAVFGEVEELYIYLPKEPESNLLIKGQRYQNQSYVLAAEGTLDSEGKFTLPPFDTKVLVSTFADGDPFLPKGACPLGYEDRKSEYQGGGIKFQFAYCAMPMLRATQFVIKEVTIEDPKLAQLGGAQKVTLLSKDADFGKEVEMVVSQHNWNDVLNIKLANGTYALTGKDLSVHYSDSSSVRVTLPCTHPLMCPL